MNRLHNPWRPLHTFPIKHIKWVKNPKVLETDGQAMKIDVEVVPEDQLIDMEMEEAYWAQFPTDEEYSGYVLDQVEVYEKRLQNKRKKRENKGKRRVKREVIPNNLKDQVTEFLVRYAQMKSEAITNPQKEELRQFVDTNRIKLYNQLKKYRGNGYAEVDTLLTILTEKPSI